jgi:hypothetical protein
MSRIISIRCPNIVHCGHINVFPESDLIGEVPLIDKEGARIPPPPVEIDENTFVKCEKCGYPVSCEHAVISDSNINN